MKQADRIRQHALTHHVRPARAADHGTLTIRVGDVCRDMGLQNRVPNVCSALRSRAFLDLAGLEFLERIGPEQSTTTRFQYAIRGRAGRDTAIITSQPAKPVTGPRESSGFRRDPTRAADRHLNLVVVIQCAASKDPRAGHLVDENGSRALFVAHPAEAPYNRSVIYRRPDDSIRDGRAWRDEVLEYNNRRGEDNPMGLLPAWQLYDRPVYRELVHALGAENVFILSAGWGLLSADFLTPNYDITFSTTAERYKRRRVRDRYRDFCMLSGDRIEPVVFLGGKDYVPLFQSVTESIRGTRIIFYNSAEAPDAPDCVCIRFETRTRTNWHYECARALIQGTLDIPV